MPRTSRELGNFLATDPSGNSHRVYARQDFNVTYGAKGLSDAPAGPVQLNLADGTTMIRVTKGVYEITVGKVRLTSKDRSAV